MRLEEAGVGCVDVGAKEAARVGPMVEGDARIEGWRVCAFIGRLLG
jgi:hypothetical protein